MDKMDKRGGKPMKKTMFFALALIFSCAAALCASEKKSLLIMFDGLRGDVLQSAATPNLDTIRDGSWADGYRGAWTYQAHTNLDSDPSSATNHVAIITGVTATKNGCFNNGQTKDAKWGEYPPYLARLKKADPSLVTVWLYNWGEDADIPTNADFFAAPRGGFDGDMGVIDDAVAFLNGTFPDVTDYKGNEWKAGTDPDAIALYLDSMDIYGHGEGFSVFVPEYRQKMAKYDERVGDLLSAIRSRPNFANEDWQIVVVSDHGGYKTGHGIPTCENCYTIPLFVSSKTVSAGRMVGQPQNCDVAAYIMEHLTGAIPPEFDGKIEKTVIDSAPDIESGLLAYFPFDGDLNDAAGKITATAGAKTPSLSDLGFSGQGAILRDGASLSFGALPELNAANAPGLSCAFWFRTPQVQSGDPPLISNKNWESGQNPGFALLANYNGPSGNTLYLNIGDGANRDDIGGLDYYPDSRWRFVAFTAEYGGNAVLYLGDDAGNLAFVSDSIADLGSLETGLNWFLGQDGTGAYSKTLNNVKIDELRLWSRPLSTDEIRAVYGK